MLGKISLQRFNVNIHYFNRCVLISTQIVFSTALSGPFTTRRSEFLISEHVGAIDALFGGSTAPSVKVRSS